MENYSGEALSKKSGNFSGSRYGVQNFESLLDKIYIQAA